MKDQILYYKKAAKIFNNIKNELINNILLKNNITIKDIVEFIENKIKLDTNYDYKNPLLGGIAFPSCIGINNIIAHYTPTLKSNNYIIKKNDLIKIDFGVHINGFIIDSAFTFSKSHKFDELINIGKKTNNYALKLCKPDKNIYELGKDIEEYVESKEITINNKTYNLSTIKNLSGHDITRFNIHGGKTIPSYPNEKFINNKILENDIISIEPFITTNERIALKGNYYTIFQLNNNNTNFNKINKNEKKLLFDIKNNFNNLAFSYKYIKNDFNLSNKNIFDNLILKKFIKKDSNFYVKNSYVTHFESNAIITKNGNIRLT
jgi:methionyl aminopeptidase